MKVRKVIVIGTLFFTGLFVLFFTVMHFDHKALYDQVASDFARKHSTYLFVDCAVGEGDGAVAYVHVRFKKSIGEKEQEEVWQYWDTADHGWLHRDEFLQLKK